MDLMSLKPGQRMFTLTEIQGMLEKAHEMGLPLEAGSWMEELTLSQIERLVNGVHDA